MAPRPRNRRGSHGTKGWVLLTGRSGKYSQGVSGGWEKVMSILSHSPQSRSLRAHVSRGTFATRPFPALPCSRLWERGGSPTALRLPQRSGRRRRRRNLTALLEFCFASSFRDRTVLPVATCFLLNVIYLFLERQGTFPHF